MRVLGIDPGLRFTGYGCVDLPPGRLDPVLVEGGVVRLRAGDPLERRLEQLYADLCAILEELGPDRLVVERIFTHERYQATSIRMGHARGVVLLAARHHGVLIDELTPAEIKKATTGNGQATKPQMQRAVMSAFGLREPPRPPDVADAIAIAACGARRAACSVPL